MWYARILKHALKNGLEIYHKNGVGFLAWLKWYARLLKEKNALKNGLEICHKNGGDFWHG